MTIMFGISQTDSRHIFQVKVRYSHLRKYLTLIVSFIQPQVVFLLIEN